MSKDQITEYIVIDIQGESEITTGMEELNIAEKTSKLAKSQVTDFQSKQKEVKRLRMCLHGKLLEWEDEFNKAEDSHDYEELKDSLDSTSAGQLLERFRAAWDETSDSASKL